MFHTIIFTLIAEPVREFEITDQQTLDEEGKDH